MKFLEEIDRLIKDNSTSPEAKIRLKSARDEALAKYRLGDRVIVDGIEETLTIVDREVYSATGQHYSVVHSDPNWLPPEGFTINQNHGMPRVCLNLCQIKARA